MLLDLCHFRSNNFLSLCVLYKRKKGGGGEDNHRAIKIRVGQEPRKRKEKGGVLSLYCILQQRSWWPCFQNGEPYAIHKLERFLEADVCMCFFHLSPDLANKT